MHTISVFKICTGNLPGIKNENVKNEALYETVTFSLILNYLNSASFQKHNQTSLG